MNTETKTCQSCKSQFTIEPEDFAFYEKVKVPPPTFCPTCRMQRRMVWRNERSLYHRTCSATGKNIITMFAPEQPFVVYDRNYWWSDEWDQCAAGREYDFAKPFFVQFKDLLERAPLPNLANSNVVNSEYGNHNADVKNCYLTYASFKDEDVVYSAGVVGCKDSLDLYTSFNSTQCYDDVLCGDLNRVSFSYDSDESMDSAFLHACKNMNSSLACINLRNKSYTVFNEQHSKEEYARERAKYDFGSYRALTDFRELFRTFIARHPRRHGFITKSINTTGDNVINAKNVRMGFDLFGGIEDSKYLVHGVDARDVYDAYGVGGNMSTAYEVVDTGIEGAWNLFAVFTHGCRNTEYTYACHSLSDCFGCVGLRSKRYCILNKQYSKEEYEALVPKIKEQMGIMPYADERGRVYAYGEFFPAEISPFAYNETIAHEYYPKTESQVVSEGHKWRYPDLKQYSITLEPENLPDHIKDVSDSLLSEVIRCEHNGKCNEQCTSAFRVISSELQFYRAMNLALPRLCPNCRHFSRIARRTPIALWERECHCGGIASQNGAYSNTTLHQHGETACKNKFTTSYAPDRPEIVYCESCYNAEVA